MSKFTQWFYRDIPPARSGWYQVKGPFLENKTGKEKFKGFTFRFFDVDYGLWFWDSADGFTIAAFGNDDQWRGLTKESK